MNRPTTYDLRPTTFFWILLLVVGCLLSANNVSAQQQPPKLTEYQLLAPIPLKGGDGGETPKTTAEDYIPGLFKLTIMLATGLAVLFIIWGGVQYMSTDAFTGKESAKETIWNAIMGLLLALSAWLIISTINPNLMKFNLSIERFEIKKDINKPGMGGATPGGRSGYALTPEEIAAHNAIEKQLGENTPPVIVNANPCVSGNTTGCTNLVNLPQNAINGVMTLASSCLVTIGKDCNVRISGGTEGGHATHGPGLPVVDLSKNNILNDYITKNSQSTPNANCGLKSAPKYSLGGATYVDEGNHWHVCY